MKVFALFSVQRTAVAAAAIWMSAAAAHSAEVKLQGISDDSLAATVRGGSLLIEQTMLEDNPPTTSEILAAAQADYKRLLAVLYDNGYFSGAVTISVDGREAASIPPVHPPSQIAQINITIDTGPKFTFGRAAIAPIAPGSEIPK